MIFRGGGGEGKDDIHIRKEGRKGRYRQVRLLHYLYLSIVFITPSKEVSLESIFQVALLSHIFQTPPTGRQIQVQAAIKSPDSTTYSVI